MDLFIQYAIAASQFAMDDARLQITDENAPDVGAFIGVGHRRIHHDRAGAHRAARGRSAQDLALLHSVRDHQPRGRPGVDPVRRQGAEPRRPAPPARRRRTRSASRSRSSAAATPTR